MTKREIPCTLIICCVGSVLPHGDDKVARGAGVVSIVLHGLGIPKGVIKAKAPEYCRVIPASTLHGLVLVPF